MTQQMPAHARDVQEIIAERLNALNDEPGLHETATIEWRGDQRTIAVISVPIGLLSYNPDTHRVRAQRTLDSVRDQNLTADPFGTEAQAYLHDLLKGDPADPSKVDPTFVALKDDLAEHGQTEPGIVTRAGVLINGNTRCAALRDLGKDHMRVGVLPIDAAYDDMLAIELSLQLRRDHKRDYSFMNSLLAIEEQVQAGRLPVDIQRAFRIRATTYERSRWILDFVEQAMERSRVTLEDGTVASLRLIDFEQHQGKLEELYRAYMVLKARDPEQAETLREQRLLAIVFDRSKTDLRLIDHDFASVYMPEIVPETGDSHEAPQSIPGTSITVEQPSRKVAALRSLTTSALQARAIARKGSSAAPEAAESANEQLVKIGGALENALDLAGRNIRVLKKKLAAADRLADAGDLLKLAVTAVADARATGNFIAEDLDEPLIEIRRHLQTLAIFVVKSDDADGEGLTWLRDVGASS